MQQNFTCTANCLDLLRGISTENENLENSHYEYSGNSEYVLYLFFLHHGARQHAMKSWLRRCHRHSWTVRAATGTMTADPVFTVLHLHAMQTRSIAMRIMSVSVYLSNACTVTKRKKNQSRFLYHKKDHLS